MSDGSRTERFWPSRRRRPFDLARGAPRPIRYPPDGLDLTAAAELIAEAPVEIGYGFDAAGRQIFRQVGLAETITGFRLNDLARLRDGTFMHNHPPYDYPVGDPRRRAGSFSASDLVFMYEYGLAELIVVTEDRIYDLQRDAEGFYLDPVEIQDEYALRTQIIRRHLGSLVARGELAREEADAEGRLADEVMNDLGPFFTYSWWERR